MNQKLITELLASRQISSYYELPGRKATLAQLRDMSASKIKKLVLAIPIVRTKDGGTADVIVGHVAKLPSEKGFVTIGFPHTAIENLAVPLDEDRPLYELVKSMVGILHDFTAYAYPTSYEMQIDKTRSVRLAIGMLTPD